jgi:hypothetical protein
VVCPHCGQTVELEDPGHGPEHAATGASRRRAHRVDGWWPGLHGWRWAGEPIVVGFLGFTFWNWPPLSESFIAQVALSAQT